MASYTRVKSLVIAGTFVALVLAACAGPANTRGATPAPAGREQASQTGDSGALVPRTTLKVAYVPVLAFAPLYRGLAKGYFTDAGIDVDLLVVQSASDAIAFLGTGQMDVAFGNVGAPFFNAVNRDINVRVVGGNAYYQRDPATLAATPLLVRRQLMDEGTVRSPADLKGRSVAINAPAGILEYSLARVLAGSQLTLEDVDVRVMAFPDMLTALTNGAIDSAILAEPFSVAARSQGIASVLVPNPAPGATITAVMYGENLLKPESEAIGKRFLDALRKAVNELQTEDAIFTAENLAIWTQYTNLPEQQIRQGAPSAYAANLAVDVASLLDQQQYLMRAGRLDAREPLPESRIVDARFLARG